MDDMNRAGIKGRDWPLPVNADRYVFSLIIKRGGTMDFFKKAVFCVAVA